MKIPRRMKVEQVSFHMCVLHLQHRVKKTISESHFHHVDRGRRH